MEFELGGVYLIDFPQHKIANLQLLTTHKTGLRPTNFRTINNNNFFGNSYQYQQNNILCYLEDKLISY